jgi:hypothetical protein
MLEEILHLSPSDQSHLCKAVEAKYLELQNVQQRKHQKLSDDHHQDDCPYMKVTEEDVIRDCSCDFIDRTGNSSV